MQQEGRFFMGKIINYRADYVVSLKDINLRYSGDEGPVAALTHINLNIKEGEFICVLGPSGCGKSTLLKIIAGLLQPSDGDAKMDINLLADQTVKEALFFKVLPYIPG
jgi:taurine transport system ATP-binding protein